MARVKLDFGAEVDILSGSEHARHTAGLPAAFAREQARGLKHFRVPVLTGTSSAAGAITLGSTGSAPPAGQPGSPTISGPLRGYAWKVTRISVWGLSGTDVLSLYWGEPDPRRFVHNFTATAPDWETSRGLLLKDGDFLCLSGTITVSETITMNGEAVEAPAELIYKLIGG